MGQQEKNIQRIMYVSMVLSARPFRSMRKTIVERTNYDWQVDVFEGVDLSPWTGNGKFFQTLNIEFRSIYSQNKQSFVPKSTLLRNWF